MKMQFQVPYLGCTCTSAFLIYPRGVLTMKSEEALSECW